MKRPIRWGAYEVSSVPLLWCVVSLLRQRRRGVRVARIADDGGGHLLAFDPPPGVAVRSTGVVYLHGGGWRRGSPRQYASVGLALAGWGFRTILPSLGRVPRACHPEQLEDAFRGVREALARSTGLPARAIVIGHSSGAQLAACAVLDTEAQRRLGVAPRNIAGLATIAGPLDLSLCGSGFVGWLAEGLAGPPGSAVRQEADPVQHVTGPVSFPVLCLHGRRDPVVPVECSRSFVDRLDAASPGAARLTILEDLHHVDTLRVFLSRHHLGRRVLVDWLAGIESDASHDLVDHPSGSPNGARCRGGR